MIVISIPDAPKVQEQVVSWQKSLHAALLEKANMLAVAVQQKVEEKLGGDSLQSKSGLLKSSIANVVNESSNGVSASVYVNGDIPYAAIQEYGGVTKAHVIAAVNAKTLSFSSNGKTAFAAYVNHPGSNIPGHSYLRASLSEMQEEIVDGMAGGVADVLH